MELAPKRMSSSPNSAKRWPGIKTVTRTRCKCICSGSSPCTCKAPALVMQEHRKNNFYGRGASDALTALDTPTLMRQFGEFLDHAARRAEFERSGLSLSDVMAPDDDDAPAMDDGLSELGVE